MRILIRLSLKTKSTLLYTYFCMLCRWNVFHPKSSPHMGFWNWNYKEPNGPGFLKIFQKNLRTVDPRYFKNLTISMKELAKKLANFPGRLMFDFFNSFSRWLDPLKKKKSGYFHLLRTKIKNHPDTWWRYGAKFWYPGPNGGLLP